jgi:LDH2 family malate/lactate/ureidoglycolate dehydrogenase
VAAPIGKGEYMEFDMATSVVSRAKIAEAATRSDPLPAGWAVDETGRDTRDASAALQGSLLPFGGQKGYALVFALEVLIGVLSGGAYADLVSSKEAAPDVPEKVSHFFLAVDLKRSLGVEPFVQRMQDLVRRVVDLPVGPGVAPIRYPGQRRWKLRRKRFSQGIPLVDKDYQHLIDLARMLDVKLEKKPSK